LITLHVNVNNPNSRSVHAKTSKPVISVFREEEEGSTEEQDG
jgi:endonuclease V-like protein UPF0215 family